MADDQSEGFWASEEEAAAEEAAWADQAASETAVSTELVPAMLVVYDENDEDPLDPLDVPDHYDLPMHGSIVNCPKCGAPTPLVAFHGHGVLSEPCGQRFGFPDIQNLGEHLCRTCTRCAYGWPEQVLSGTA